MNENAPHRLSSSELREQLEEACEKLIYISETDSPVEPFQDAPIDVISKSTVAVVLGRKPIESVEQLDIRVFFEKLTRNREWHNSSQKRTTERFKQLEKLLIENLEDPGVFRFGTIRIDIFVVGKDASGKLVGVRTMAVET